MVVKNKRIEKACCFYVSEFHLEMILVPYINKKIEEDITILTEKNLNNTINTLISKMNLEEKIKQKILNLKWYGDLEIKENSNIIIIGSKEYMEMRHIELRNKNVLSILDCYDFELEKENMDNILRKYENTLNTLGKNNL